MFKLKKERINFQNELGSGASGTVYPYQKDKDDLKWVVKIIHAANINKLLTYLPEIVLGFSCDHPCIVPIKGYNIEKAGQVDYYIYLKLPRMRKETLRDKLIEQKRSNQPFPEQEIVKYFYSMVCAVDYLHKKEIHHQDIKPGNILFDENDDAMLSDVGAAKLVGGEERYQPLTGQGGTVDYTAPELLKDRSNRIKESLIAGDAWSLGLVMLELCKLDFRLFSPYSAREEIEKAQESLSKQLKNKYSEKLLELIFQLLKFEPNQRIRIADLKEKLEAEYKCCLGDPEKIEKRNIDNNEKTEKDANQEMIELVENLLQENSQLHNQLKDYRCFFNKFKEEVLTELQKNGNETVKKLLINYQDAFKILSAGEQDKKFQSEISLIKRQEEERIGVSQSLIKPNELEREEKEEFHESIPKGHDLASPKMMPDRKRNRGTSLKRGDWLHVGLLNPSPYGQTNIWHRLVFEHYSDYYPYTIGADCKKLTLNRDEKDLKFIIWDLKGSEKFRAATSGYLKIVPVVIITFDITDRSTFDDLPSLIEFVNNNTESLEILFVVGNKLDLESERKVTKEEAEAFAEKHESVYLEVSAKMGVNIDILRKKLEDFAWQKFYSIVPPDSIQEKKKSSFWNFFG